MSYLTFCSPPVIHTPSCVLIPVPALVPSHTVITPEATNAVVPLLCLHLGIPADADTDALQEATVPAAPAAAGDLCIYVIAMSLVLGAQCAITKTKSPTGHLTSTSLSTSRYPTKTILQTPTRSRTIPGHQCSCGREYVPSSCPSEIGSP